ncbi:unnamed protein product, partial [Symbiodinium pilosum]
SSAPPSTRTVALHGARNATLNAEEPGSFLSKGPAKSDVSGKGPEQNGRAAAMADLWRRFDGNFSGFCEALAVGSLQDTSISVTLAQPEEPDCPLVGVSQGFQQLTGYARDEVLGRNCRFLNRGCAIPQEDRLRLRSCVRSQGSFAGLLQNRRKSGQVFLNFVSIHTLRVGSIFYMLGFQADMTHQQSDSRANVQRLVEFELDTIVSAILHAQKDVLSRLQVLEDFDQKAWLLRKDRHACN